MAGVRNSRANEQQAGSPPGGEPAFLVVGKLRAPHGVRGEILMEVITDFPERLQPGVTVLVGEEHQPQRIRSRRTHNKGLLISLEGYSTPETVGVLRNALVYVTTADRPALPKGEYYHHQLLGLRVLDDDGQELGRIIQILTSAANDIYVVRGESGSEILLPAIEEVILEIDLENGLLRAHLLPGLV
jgi:16S rRNA processing protein RimM